jgi:hypothetical protein
MKIPTLLPILLLFTSITSLHFSPPPYTHSYSYQASKTLSDSIKSKMYPISSPSISNKQSLTDKKFADALVSDLNTDKDENRKLKEIDITSATQLLGMFNVNSHKCVAGRDGKVRGEGLKCLNVIWKRYVP